jgi:MFS family permease
LVSTGTTVANIAVAVILFAYLIRKARKERRHPPPPDPEGRLARGRRYQAASLIIGTGGILAIFAGLVVVQGIVSRTLYRVGLGLIALAFVIAVTSAWRQISREAKNR